MHVTWGLATARFRNRQAESGSRALLAAAALLPLLPWLVVPIVERSFKPAPSVARAIRERVDLKTTPVYMKTFKEPTLVFYLDLPADRSVTVWTNSVGEWAREPGQAVLVVRRDQFDTCTLPGHVSTLVKYPADRLDPAVVALGRRLAARP